MISKLRHTGFVVRNLNRSVVFYEALGFKTWKREIEQGQFLETVVDLKNVRVETAKLKAQWAFCWNCCSITVILWKWKYLHNLQINWVAHTLH